jgi:uncharacterized protein involved in exopolysaccharide biosynthesis
MPVLHVQDSPISISDYVELLSRQKVWVFGSMFAALVVSVAIAFLWPDTYLSVATIRVVPPQVPENFVPANVIWMCRGASVPWYSSSSIAPR